MLLNQLIYIIIRLLVISITKHMLFVTGAAVTGANTICPNSISMHSINTVFFALVSFDIFIVVHDDTESTG